MAGGKNTYQAKAQTVEVDDRHGIGVRLASVLCPTFGYADEIFNVTLTILHSLINPGFCRHAEIDEQSPSPGTGTPPHGATS